MTEEKQSDVSKKSENEPGKQEWSVALTPKAFERRYNEMLGHLDNLHRGTFSDTEADEAAALCLLTSAAAIKIVGHYESIARGCKRDIDFAKAQAYARLKKDPPDGKKLTEPALANAIIEDKTVQEKIDAHINAEKDFKEMQNILDLLKDAHITFRGISRKV